MKTGIRILGLAVLLLGLMVGQVAAGELAVQVSHLNLSLTADGELHVTEQFLLFNPGESFTEEGFLSFALPAAAENVHYGEGVDEAQVEIKDNLLILHQEVPAGETTLSFHYLLAPENGELNFAWEKEFSFDTPNFFVMTALGELLLDSDELEDQGVMAMGEKQLHIYGGAFQVGDSLTLKVRPDLGSYDLGGSYPPAGGVNKVPAFHPHWLVHGWLASPLAGIIDPHLFFILLIGIPLGFLYSYNRGRDKGGAQDTKAGARPRDEQKRRYQIRERALKEKLVELERDKARGSIEQAEYEAQLELLKKKLLEVRVKLKNFTH